MGAKLKRFFSVPLMALVLVMGLALTGAFAADGVVNTSVADFRVNLDRTVTDTSKAVNVVVELLDEQGRVDVFAETNVDHIYVSAGSIIGTIHYSNNPDETGDDAGSFAANTAKIATTNGRAGFNITYNQPGTDTLRFYVVVVDTDGDTLTIGPKEYNITVNQAPNQADQLRLISMTPDDTTKTDNKEIDYTADNDSDGNVGIVNDSDDDAVDDTRGQIDAGEAFTLQVKALKSGSPTIYQNGTVTVKFVPVDTADSDGNNAYSSDCSNVVTVEGIMENGVAFIHVPAGTLTKAGKYAIYLSAESVNGTITQETVGHIFVDALGPAKVSASLDRDYINDSNIVSPTLTVSLVDQYGNKADKGEVTSNVDVTVSATNGVLLSGASSTTVTVSSGNNSTTLSSFSVDTGDNAPTVDANTGMGSSTISIACNDYEVETSELSLTIYEKKLVAKYEATQTYTAGTVLSDSIRVGVAADGNSSFTTASVFTVTQDDTNDDFDVAKFEIGNDSTDPANPNLQANPIQWDNGGTCQTENTATLANGKYWVVRVEDGTTSGIKVTLLDEDGNTIATADNQSEGSDITLSASCGGVTGYVVVNIPSGTHTSGATEEAYINVQTTLKTKQVQVDLYDPDVSTTEPVDSVTSMVGVDGLVALKFTKANTGDGDEYFKVTYLSSGYQYQPGATTATTITVNPADAYTMKVYQEASSDYDACAGTGTASQEITSVAAELSGGTAAFTFYGSADAASADGEDGDYYVQIEDAYGNEITSGTIYWESDSDPLNPTLSTTSFDISEYGTATYDEAGTDNLTFSTDIPGVQPVTVGVTVTEPTQIASVEVVPATEYVLTNGEIPVVVRAYDENGDLIAWSEGDFKVIISDPSKIELRQSDRSTVLENGDNLPASATGEYVLSLLAYNTPGDLTITVRNVSGSIQGSATVQIVNSVDDIPAPVASVVFSPASVSIEPSGSMDVTLTVMDSEGNGLADKTCTIETDAADVAEPAVASVTTGADGTATVTINAGAIESEAHITATCEGVSGMLTVTVTQAPACSADNLSACTTEEDCTAAGGYWYDNACHAQPQGEAQEPPTGEGMTEMVDPAENSYMPYEEGAVGVNFNYTAPVYVFAGMFSCDFSQVWWLNWEGGSCFFGEDIPMEPVESLSCSDVELPTDAGYVFWMVVNTDDLGSYDWQSNYLLQFYQVGECE